METNRISQHNAGVMLELSIPNDYEMLRYVYDGYTYAMGYKPIRKPKTRKKVRREFHNNNLSQLRAHELVGRLVQFDELQNAKSYKEFEKYMNAMLEGVKYSYSIVHDIGFNAKHCKGLWQLRVYTYRYLTENY